MLDSHSSPNRPQKVEANAAPPLSIATTPVVPIDFGVNTYTRFIGTFEANEFGSGWMDECLSWKTDCYIGDWSPLYKIRVRGPDAKKFFEYISTNHWPNFEIGQCKHLISCQDNGTVIGEGLIMMLGQDDFLYTSVPGVTWAIFQFYHGDRAFDATLEVVSDDWYLFQVQGPKSIQLLDELTGDTTRDIKFMRAKEMSIDGSKFLCLRQGVSGEVGFELWGPAKDGQKIYSAILKVGHEKFGLRQLGGRAKPVNHVEAGFVTPALEFLPAFHGDTKQLREYRQFLKYRNFETILHVFSCARGSFNNDPIAHHRTPFDLGWDWLVKFDHEFIGKEALQEIAKDPPHKLVSLVWDTKDIVDVFSSLFTSAPYDFMEMPRATGAIEGSAVYNGDNQQIGCALSRCYSYWFKEMISLAIISKESAEPGTEVVVLWGHADKPQKKIRAVVQKAPYKEDGRKGSLKDR